MSRPRVDQLTDDQLDQLYAELWHLRLDKEGADLALQAAVRKAEEQRQRAEKAEAELTALKTIATGYCPECGRGDCSPTAQQWLDQRDRANTAEAAIARVRALADQWAILRAHGSATTELLAALDGPA